MPKYQYYCRPSRQRQVYGTMTKSPSRQTKAADTLLTTPYKHIMHHQTNSEYELLLFNKKVNSFKTTKLFIF